MKKLYISFCILHFAFCILHSSEAQIINVPADQPTIQAGINATADGDTVLVADGTYLENINFMGKAITVASHFILLDSDTNHIYQTIIDGSGNVNPNMGTVVTFESNEDTTSVLCGFTITGGSGTKVPYVFPVKTGGGIFFFNSGGKLENNIITGNRCLLDTLNGAVSGGAVSSGPHGTDHMIILRNNIIRKNIVWTQGNTTAWDKGWAQGGAIYMCFNAILEGNRIDSNICRSDQGISAGGAIRMIADQTDTVNQILVEIRDNVISNNESISVNFGAFAGGVSCSAANTIMEINLISLNKVESQNYCKAAGIYLDLINAYFARVVNNEICNNYDIGDASDGGAIGLYRCIEADISDNLIINNTSDLGAGISINDSYPRSLSNNTLSGNIATQYGGGFYIYGFSNVEIHNSILWNDTTSGVPNEIYVENGSSVNVSFCDIQGGWDGTGNLDLDPMFDEAGEHTYALSPGSSCIDAGTQDTTALYLPLTDILGNYRVWDGDGDYDTIIDMGAYEYGSVPLYTGIPFKIQNSKFKIDVFPNPTGGIVDCRLSMVDGRWVSLKIYDLHGREVAVVMDGKCSGDQVVRWDGSNLPAGIYFYQLRAKGVAQGAAGKIVKF